MRRTPRWITGPRGWPTPENLEETRRRYPEPMFETEGDLLAAAEDRAADAEIYEASFVWRMEREKVLARQLTR